ncbi:MAG: Smr/MutS family protein [Bacilli bacterium]|nr:Smr/MutS family protein [Bacilli bacterium]
MTLNSLIFIGHLPTLDLHGMDRDTARFYIGEFIKENGKLKNPFFVIVHGIGTGVLKRETLLVLKENRMVLDFKIAPFNDGCTLVQIKV